MYLILEQIDSNKSLKKREESYFRFCHWFIAPSENGKKQNLQNLLFSLRKKKGGGQS